MQEKKDKIQLKTIEKKEQNKIKNGIMKKRKITIF